LEYRLIFVDVPGFVVFCLKNVQATKNPPLRVEVGAQETVAEAKCASIHGFTASFSS